MNLLDDARRAAYMRSLGEAIAERRELWGWSQSHMAREIGVTQPAWSQWEAGHREPRALSFAAIAAALWPELPESDAVGRLHHRALQIMRDTGRTGRSAA